MNDFNLTDTIKILTAAAILLAFFLLPWAVIDDTGMDTLTLLDQETVLGVPSFLMLLVPVAAALALGAAVIAPMSGDMRGQIGLGIAAIGLVGLIYYARVFWSDMDTAFEESGLAFWIGIGGMVILVAQILLPQDRDAWVTLRESTTDSNTATWNRAILSRLELRTTEGRITYAAIVTVLVLLSIVVLVPFIYAFTSGLKTSRDVFSPEFQIWPETPLWENYEQAWNYFKLPRMFANTIVLVVGGMFTQIGFSLLAAYSLSRLKPIGGRYILMGFLVTLMIPGIAYIVPLYVTTARLNLLGSYWGLWLPYGVNAFMIFLLKNFFDSLPSELFDAAKVDGASAFQVFASIALPLTRPMLIVLSILTFVNLWKDFLWPYLVLLRTPDMQPISVFLFTIEQRSSTPPNIQMAGYFMAMLPPLIIAIVLQRYMQRGLSIGGVKG